MADLEARTAVFDERLQLLNQKIDLVQAKEDLLSEKSLNVLNKRKEWPYASYELCFISKILKFTNLLLPTVLIKLECDGIVFGPFRALLDTGAQPNLISYTLFKKLKCSSEQTSRRMLGVASQPFAIKRRTQVIIKPWFESSFGIGQSVYILPHANSWRPILPSRVLPVQDKDKEWRQSLADPEYYLPKEVHILLGVGFVSKILDYRICINVDGTVVYSTPLGKVVMGEQLEEADCNDENVNAIMDSEDSNRNAIINDSIEAKLSGMIERLWKQDEIEMECKKGWTQEEKMVEDYFVRTHRRDKDGRFVVKIPFKSNFGSLGSSRATALRRFYSLETKLAQDAKMREFYVNEMRELIRKGHMKKVNRQPKPGSICYHIPHHFVKVRPRIVNDASCATTRGLSLNDIQMTGPKLQKDLHVTLMRFRRHRVAVCADIKKMFHQIRVHEDQWDCQRIFWRENAETELQEYWYTVVTFGLTSSPHLAVRCIVQTAIESKNEFPEIAKILEDDFYVDDGLTGADTTAKAIRIAKGMVNVLAGPKFELGKWKSNKKAVLQAMNQESTNEEESMVFAEDGQTSVLGIKWLFAKDQYMFVVKTPSFTGPVTKRKVVSCTAQLYDPNGYAAPVTVLGKVMVQKFWIARVEWDEQVEGELEAAWRRFWSEIRDLEKFRIDRWIGTMDGAKTKLIGFSDSSQMAYGAVIYARTVYSDGKIVCRLVTSKTRVAPIKQLTIPRLELAAAELLAKLMVEVRNAMEFGDMPYILFTDSSATLHWIRKQPAQLRVYVANRVTTIQEHTDLRCWRYVNTKDNPADLLSRGCRPSALVDNKLWLYGPEWLSQLESDWPTEPFPLKALDGLDLELKVYSLTHFSDGMSLEKWNEEEEVMERKPIAEYADSLEKALRLLGYIFRYWYAKLTKYKPPKRVTRAQKVKISAPTEKEKECAMEYLLRRAQEQHFNAEITALAKNKAIHEKSKLLPLNPFLDCKGILRVGGRLAKAEMSYERKHPAIIPKRSRLAWLVMDSAHRATLHGGVQIAMQTIRQKFWIPQLRDELKAFIRNCVTCVRHKPLTQEQLMADLPSDRITPGRPFEVSGVDYAGPFNVNYRDNKGREILETKAWIVIFVCMKTRAVHLDIVDDLGSGSFIACFESFVSRRGHCYKLYSDNGTSFVGAEKAIALAYKHWQEDGLVERIAKRGTQWIFMTPAAPHQGGIYEAAVKIMKHHFKRIVGTRIMERRQIGRLLDKIEAVMNSRPLTPLTDDPEDFRALTPGHFLIGEEIVAPPPFDLNDNNLEGRRAWLERERLFKHFWERWHNEVLTTYQERKKWRKESENVKKGQMVVIKDERLPPSHWKLGRIAEVMPDAKGVVRNVIIKTENGAFKRSVQKLCILPVDSAEK